MVPSVKKSASFNLLQGHCGITIGLIISAVCKTKQDAIQIGKKNIYKGQSINDVIHFGEGGSVKRWCYFIGLYSKMGD